MCNIRDELEAFLRRSPLLITLVCPGKPRRFRAEMFSVAETITANCIAVKLKSKRCISTSFALWKGDTIFFDTKEKKWFARGENVFLVEVVGLIYNYSDYFNPDSWGINSVWNRQHKYYCALDTSHDPSSLMDKFGIAISGDNIRSILWKKLCNGVWKTSHYDIENIHEIKGPDLLALVHSMLGTSPSLLSADEKEVFERYVRQDLLLNPPTKII